MNSTELYMNRIELEMKLSQLVQNFEAKTGKRVETLTIYRPTHEHQIGDLVQSSVGPRSVKVTLEE